MISLELVILPPDHLTSHLYGGAKGSRSQLQPLYVEQVPEVRKEGREIFGTEARCENFQPHRNRQKTQSPPLSSLHPPPFPFLRRRPLPRILAARPSSRHLRCSTLNHTNASSPSRTCPHAGPSPSHRRTSRTGTHARPSPNPRSPSLYLAFTHARPPQRASSPPLLPLHRPASRAPQVVPPSSAATQRRSHGAPVRVGVGRGGGPARRRCRTTPAISIYPWRWRLSSTLRHQRLPSPGRIPRQRRPPFYCRPPACLLLPPTRDDRRSACRPFPEVACPRSQTSGPRNCTPATRLLSSRPEIRAPPCTPKAANYLDIKVICSSCLVCQCPVPVRYSTGLLGWCGLWCRPRYRRSGSLRLTRDKNSRMKGRAQ